MNVAFQINRSEINDKFGHRLSFHLHVSQSKERFWRLAQTNKPAKKHAHRFREELRGFAKLKKFKKSKKNWIELNPPTLSKFFVCWKLISDTARTLKSQWLLTTFNNVYTDRKHHIRLIPHEYSIPTLEII